MLVPPVTTTTMLPRSSTGGDDRCWLGNDCWHSDAFFYLSFPEEVTFFVQAFTHFLFVSVVCLFVLCFCLSGRSCLLLFVSKTCKEPFFTLKPFNNKTSTQSQSSDFETIRGSCHYNNSSFALYLTFQTTCEVSYHETFPTETISHSAFGRSKKRFSFREVSKIF